MAIPAKYRNIFVPFDDYVHTDEYIQGNPKYGLMIKEPRELVPGGFMFVCPACTEMENAGFASRHSKLRTVKVHYANIFIRNGNPGHIWQAWNPDGTEITLANREQANLNCMKFRRSLFPGRKCHFWVDCGPNGVSIARYLDDCVHGMKAEPGKENPVQLRPWTEYGEGFEQWLAEKLELEKKGIN